MISEWALDLKSVFHNIGTGIRCIFPRVHYSTSEATTSSPSSWKGLFLCDQDRRCKFNSNFAKGIEDTLISLSVGCHPRPLQQQVVAREYTSGSVAYIELESFEYRHGVVRRVSSWKYRGWYHCQPHPILYDYRAISDSMDASFGLPSTLGSAILASRRVQRAEYLNYSFPLFSVDSSSQMTSTSCIKYSRDRRSCETKLNENFKVHHSSCYYMLNRTC